MTGKEIKEKRKAKGLTQDELANLVGVSRVTIARWETDKRKPHPAIFRLLQFLLT